MARSYSFFSAYATPRLPNTMARALPLTPPDAISRLHAAMALSAVPLEQVSQSSATDGETEQTSSVRMTAKSHRQLAGVTNGKDSRNWVVRVSKRVTVMT